MMMRTFLILCVTLISSSCSKQTPTWLEIGHNSQVHFYIGKRVEVGLKQDSPYVGIKTLWDYQTANTNAEGKPYMSAELGLLLDCKLQLVADFSVIKYSKNMASGSVIESAERDVEEAYKDLHPISGEGLKAIADWTCEAVGKNQAWSSNHTAN